MDLIVAADRNWAIGKKGDLLYSVPEDMKYFRRMTTGKTVVMGQKTFESLPGQRPLPNRINYVLSDCPAFNPEGVIVVRSFGEMFEALSQYPEDSVMLMGGGSLYNALAKYCRRAYVTLIDAETEGADTFIPNFDALEGWSMEAVSDPVETGGYTVRFATYLNSNPAVYTE